VTVGSPTVILRRQVDIPPSELKSPSDLSKAPAGIFQNGRYPTFFPSVFPSQFRVWTKTYTFWKHFSLRGFPLFRPPFNLIGIHLFSSPFLRFISHVTGTVTALQTDSAFDPSSTTPPLTSQISFPSLFLSPPDGNTSFSYRWETMGFIHLPCALSHFCLPFFFFFVLWFRHLQGIFI